MDSKPTTAAFIPDEILQHCFARLPLKFLPIVRVVCKKWYKLGNSRYLLRIRKSLGLTEPCTFFLANEYLSGTYQGLQGQVTDLQSHTVHPIATLVGPHRLQFAATGVDGLLYILGGRSPMMCPKSLNAWEVYGRVDVYEPLGNSWHEIPPMLTARFGFAAGAFLDPHTQEPRLIVAGGYGADGDPLPLAEIHNFATGRWESISSMVKMCGALRGEVFDGKFYVQQANAGPDCVEIYDPLSGCWTTYNPNTLRIYFKISDNFGTGKAVTLHF